MKDNQYKIKDTGYYSEIKLKDKTIPRGYLSKMIIIDEGCECTYNKAILEESDKNVYVVERVYSNGDEIFHHYTSPINYEGIKEEGIHYEKSEEGNLDLGNGVYCIKKGDAEGYSNIQRYLESGDDTVILRVDFRYKGYYLRCKEGDEHEGYIVIESNIPPKNIEGFKKYNIRKNELEEIINFYEIIDKG